MKKLIILMGNRNSDDGTLLPDAIARCNEVVQIASQYDFKCHILPTGAFGAFNRYKHPHHELLTKELIDKGVPEKIILPGTYSSGSIEDILQARIRIIDNEYSKIFIVTSDYHAKRVEMLAKIYLPDIKSVIVHPVNTDKIVCNKLRKDKRQESTKVRVLTKQRIDIPLFTKEATFPAAIYENADREHKHYDTISLATITAILTISAYLTFQESEYMCFKMLGGVLVNYLLLCVYIKSADFAKTARNTMRLIELSYNQAGFSTNYFHQKYPYLMLIGNKGIRFVIYLIYIITSSILIGLALYPNLSHSID